jgi:hypothetical protein
MNAKSATLIIAIPGGNETQELPISAAREAIARGEIAPNQWVWSPEHNDWKQVSELPELQPPFENDEQPAPVPMPVPVPTPVPVPVATRRVFSRVKSSGPIVVQEQGHFGFFKFFIVALLLAVVAVIGGNYCLLDQPLEENLAQTPFGAVPVHAHLGAFLQPNALVIHLLPTKALGPDNLADFLVSLAKSTPLQPFNQTAFQTVGLTSAWKSQYMLSGNDWENLGKMEASTEDEKKEFILIHLAYPDGQPLLTIRSDVDPSVVSKFRDKIWQSLFINLVHS